MTMKLLCACVHNIVTSPSCKYPPPHKHNGVTYANIASQQQKDPLVMNFIGINDKYTLHTFRGGEKQWQLVIIRQTIVIPQAMQKRVVDWYHLHLCHPSTTRTEATIKQHFKNPRISLSSIHVYEGHYCTYIP
jgi:hypothetical protein